MSLGRIRRPPEGPPAFISRSNSSEVITFGNLPYPYLAIEDGLNTPAPVATIIVPTSNSTVSGSMSKSIARLSHASKHLAHASVSDVRHKSRSIMYVDGTAWANGV